MRTLSRLLALAAIPLGVAGPATSLAEGDPARSLRVTEWGARVREALDSGSIRALEVHGVAVKENPSRQVEVRQHHLSPVEVRSILGPAARVLEGGRFEVADTHNLATLRVSFTFDLPSICPAESTRFAIISTTRDYFYVGCVSADSSARGREDLVRIRSGALDGALRKVFPRELVR